MRGTRKPLIELVVEWLSGASRSTLQRLLTDRDRRITQLEDNVTLLESRLSWSNIKRDEAYRRFQRDRDEAYRRAKTAEKELRRLQREMLGMLTEPSSVDGCRKIRLHTEGEAFEFAKVLAADLNADSSVFNPYRCKTCPRHPATADRFWHVGHDPRVAVKRGRLSAQISRERAHREGRMLAQTVSPEVLARLQALRKVQ